MLLQYRITDKPLLIKSSVVLVAVVGFFFSYSFVNSLHIELGTRAPGPRPRRGEFKDGASLNEFNFLLRLDCHSRCRLAHRTRRRSLPRVPPRKNRMGDAALLRRPIHSHGGIYIAKCQKKLASLRIEHIGTGRNGSD